MWKHERILFVFSSFCLSNPVKINTKIQNRKWTHNLYVDFVSSKESWRIQRRIYCRWPIMFKQGDFTQTKFFRFAKLLLQSSYKECKTADQRAKTFEESKMYVTQALASVAYQVLRCSLLGFRQIFCWYLRRWLCAIWVSYSIERSRSWT